MVSQKKRLRGKKIAAGQSQTREDSKVDEASRISKGSELDEASKVDEVGGRMGEDQQDKPRSTRSFLNQRHPSSSQAAMLWLYTREKCPLCEVCKDQKDVPTGYTKLSYMIIKGSNSFAWGTKADLHVTLNQ